MVTPNADLPHSKVSAPSASPPEPIERKRSVRCRGGAERSMRSAVGGMKALRTSIFAISAKASPGSNFSNLCATTGTP